MEDFLAPDERVCFLADVLWVSEDFFDFGDFLDVELLVAIRKFLSELCPVQSGAPLTPPRRPEQQKGCSSQITAKPGRSLQAGREPNDTFLMRSIRLSVSFRYAEERETPAGQPPGYLVGV